MRGSKFQRDPGNKLKYLHFFTSDIMEESSIRARRWKTAHREKRKDPGNDIFRLYSIRPRLRASEIHGYVVYTDMWGGSG